MKFLILIAMLAITTNIWADSEHNKITNITEISNTKIINNIEDNSVIAAAMAQHHFAYGTYAYQKSVSAAIIYNSEAISGAIAHRACKDCGLFSASISLGNINNSIKTGIGIGYTWSY